MGIAKPVKIARIAVAMINSTSVKPRIVLRPVFRIVQFRNGLDMAIWIEFAAENSMGRPTLRGCRRAGDPLLNCNGCGGPSHRPRLHGGIARSAFRTGKRALSRSLGNEG